LDFCLFITTIWNTIHQKRTRLLIPLQIYTSANLSGQVKVMLIFAPTNFSCSVTRLIMILCLTGNRRQSLVYIFFVSLKATYPLGFCFSEFLSARCLHLDGIIIMDAIQEGNFLKIIFKKSISSILGTKKKESLH
jgi:hypothetical protein